MADSHPEEMKPHHEAAWSKIIEVVIVCGGSVEKTQSGYALVRKAGTMLLHFPLPIAFDPAMPDKCGQPSPFATYSIERNLDLKLPYYPVL